MAGGLVAETEKEQISYLILFGRLTEEMRFFIGGAKMKEKFGILIVDDDEELAQGLKQSLEADKSFDWAVDVCTDSAQALGYLKKKSKHYDVVLLDIKMPRLTGREILQMIKKAFPDIHVIIISAYLDEYNRDELIRFGAYHIFEKPLHMDKLKDYIKRAIEDIEITTIKIKGLDLRKALYMTAMELIFKALRKSDWHIQNSSGILNISRWCLERWMKKLHIHKAV